MKKIFSDEQIQFIKDNYRTMPYRDIAAALGGFTERQVRGKINGMGLKKNREFNEDYFMLIDSPNRAYWLGFLYADGWVVNNDSSHTYEVSIELNSEDEYILRELAYELGDVHKITYSHDTRDFNGYHYETNSAVLRIYSKRMVHDLISNGVVERKTCSDRFPKIGVFLRDFVRGYLDGDGCIYNNKNKYASPVIHFTNANKEFLNYLNMAIECELGIKGSIYSERENKHRLMFYRKDDVKTLLDWIYYDSSKPMLLRKYNKYLEAFGLAA